MKFIFGRVVRYRRELKLKRADLARLMQKHSPTISAETIRAWEVGRSKPKADNLLILAKCLGKKPKDFFDF